MKKEKEKFKLINKVDLTALSIDGDRVSLRSIDESYAPSIFEEFSEDITHFMLPKPAEKIEETLSFVSESVARMKEGWDLVFVILKKENEKFLGCCGFHGRGNPRTPELGIWLRKAAHGRKYGREAIRIVSHWALENLDFDYLIYPVDRENIPSRKIPESMGGIVYEKRKVKTMRGGFLDEVVFKLTKEQIRHNNKAHITA